MNTPTVNTLTTGTGAAAGLTPDGTALRSARSFSTREMQAAALLVAGRSTGGGDTVGTRAATGTARASVEETAVSVPGSLAGPSRRVRVRAANAAAGASTITLMLADAADAAGLRTRVLDAAAPSWSGLAAASATELGTRDGWRRGRRGRGVLIDRVDVRIPAPDLIPAPREADGIDLTVLDAGWTVRELDNAARAGRGCWVAEEEVDVEVVATRATTQALGQAEAVLEQLTARLVLVVVVGPRRMSRPLVNTAGPRLRRLHEDQAVVCLPRVPARLLPGLGAEPLPRQLIGTGRRLLGRITAVTGPIESLPASSRPALSRKETSTC